MKLDESGTFWLGGWTLVATTICVLIISITSYNISKTNTINELIENGHSPLEASCAIDDKRAPTCLVLAVTK